MDSETIMANKYAKQIFFALLYVIVGAVIGSMLQAWRCQDSIISSEVLTTGRVEILDSATGKHLGAFDAEDKEETVRLLILRRAK